MKDKEDDKGTVEQNPTEEATAEAGNATALDCERKAGIEAEAETLFVSFREEVADAFQPEPDFMVPGADGLPVPANETVDPLIAPPFTVDHVVCLEDTRQWVELFEDEFDSGWIKRFDQVFLGSVKTRKRFSPEGEEDERTIYPAEWVIRRFDMDFVKMKDKYVPVRPIRERCAHYQRQVVSNDGIPDPTEPGHRIIFRNCMARRSIGGAYLSLRDEAIYACDYRSPVDPKSTETYLDGPDRERLKSEAYKTRLPLFRKA